MDRNGIRHVFTQKRYELVNDKIYTYSKKKIHYKDKNYFFKKMNNYSLIYTIQMSKRPAPNAVDAKTENTAKVAKTEKKLQKGDAWVAQWLRSAFGSGHDPRVLESSPVSGFPQGVCFSLCLCLCLSLSLSL